MAEKHIALVGATGAVGREVLRILEERNVPMASLRPIASERSAGRTIAFRGQELPVTVIGDEAFDGIDLAIWDTPDDVALDWVPRLRDRCVNVDNSAAFRLQDDVPLVIPEINADAARGHTGIVANPNCTMTTMILPLAPLHRAFGAHRVIVSSYQSVSGAGVPGVEDLYEQLEKLLPERDAVRSGNVEVPPGRAFKHPIAFNVIPHVGGFDANGTTSEERRMATETQKILASKIDIFATAVRVPTLVAHGVSVWVRFAQHVTAEAARDVLVASEGVYVEDDPATFRYPTALLATGKDKSYVGRIRADAEDTNALGFFATCDNLRKGAALNAVQIAELLLRDGLV